MPYLSYPGIALFLGLTHSLGGDNGQMPVPHSVTVLHLPATAIACPSAAGVCRYILRPQYRTSPNYLFVTDTTAIPLLEGPTYGLYYTGHGRTDHSPSRYQVVYWLHHELFWVEKPTDWPTQQKLLKNWFKAVGFPFDAPEPQQVQTQVKRFVQENQQRVNSDVF
jgi:hypothetical protein